MTLYKQTFDVRKFNYDLLCKKHVEPGWFNNPHVLLVGLNPKQVKGGKSDYELIEELMPENIQKTQV